MVRDSEALDWIVMQCTRSLRTGTKLMEINNKTGPRPITDGWSALEAEDRRLQIRRGSRLEHASVCGFHSLLSLTSIRHIYMYVYTCRYVSVSTINN